MTVIAPRHTNYKVFSSQCLAYTCQEQGGEQDIRNSYSALIPSLKTGSKEGWLQENHTLLLASKKRPVRVTSRDEKIKRGLTLCTPYPWHCLRLVLKIVLPSPPGQNPGNHITVFPFPCPPLKWTGYLYTNWGYWSPLSVPLPYHFPSQNDVVGKRV